MLFVMQRNGKWRYVFHVRNADVMECLVQNDEVCIVCPD